VLEGKLTRGAGQRIGGKQQNCYYTFNLLISNKLVKLHGNIYAELD